METPPRRFLGRWSARDILWPSIFKLSLLDKVSQLRYDSGTLIISNLCIMLYAVNPSSVNPTKWSNILIQFVARLQSNYLNVFGHFVGLALKRVKSLTFKKSWDVMLFNFQWHIKELGLEPGCSSMSPLSLINLMWYNWYTTNILRIYEK